MREVSVNCARSMVWFDAYSSVRWMNAAKRNSTKTISLNKLKKEMKSSRLVVCAGVKWWCIGTNHRWSRYRSQDRCLGCWWCLPDLELWRDQNSSSCIRRDLLATATKQVALAQMSIQPSKNIIKEEQELFCGQMELCDEGHPWHWSKIEATVLFLWGFMV